MVIGLSAPRLVVVDHRRPLRAVTHPRHQILETSLTLGRELVACTPKVQVSPGRPLLRISVYGSRTWAMMNFWAAVPLQPHSCVQRPARNCPPGMSRQCPVVPEIRDSSVWSPRVPPQAQRVLLMLALQSHKAMGEPSKRVSVYRHQPTASFTNL